jgi:uncharacterized protein (DUF58 family)
MPIRGAMSGLTTRGRCLLAAGVAAALCSAILNERDLLRVAIFVIVLPVLAAILAATARVGLSARRSVLAGRTDAPGGPARVTVGDRADVVLDIQATGRIPAGGLLLEDGLPAELGGRPRFVVERLRRRTGARLSYPVQPVLRGIHQLGPLRGKVTDPFGLAEFEHELAALTRLVVVPRVVPLTGLPNGSGQGTGDDGSIRLRSGQGEDDAIVRQYRRGDDLRRVHWRSTARRNELMVRVEERPWRGGTTLLLDRRQGAHRGSGPTASLEWAVSFCASASLHLRRCGQQVRLLAEDGSVLVGAESAHSDEVLLDTLAAVRPSGRRELAGLGDPGAGQELIAVLGSLSPVAAAELARSRARRARNLAVLLDTAAWANPEESRAADPSEAASLLREAGWAVVVVAPGTPIDELWSQACRTASAGRLGAGSTW